MVGTLVDQIAVEEIGSGRYVSRVLPERMGNTQPIAYGGCTIAVAVSAAHRTVKPSYSLYSVTGYFLGPASTTEKLYCTVHTVRDTKTFATRRVQVTQAQPNGQGDRICLELTADFHVEEDAFMTYSAAPPKTFASTPEQCMSLQQLTDKAVTANKISSKAGKGLMKMFELLQTFFDARQHPESMIGQKLMGLLKGQATTQDELHITDKTSTDWVRARETLATPSERMAAATFLMDGALSFAPLTHSGRTLSDAGACSTLDFALRLFRSDFRLNEWHFREIKTIAGGSGRTYSEARIWDDKGNIVAAMTQAPIMRPKLENGASNKL